MNYLYYPGCSLEGTSREYDLSTRALLSSLDVPITEIPEWTCCGASAAESVSYLLSMALPARVLALAEKMEDCDSVLVPCSACYLNLKKVEETVKTDLNLLGKINTVLAEEDLALKNVTRVKHLLEVLSKDIGADPINSKLKKPLSNLSIAPYYGCQCLRPFPVFDDPESPSSMEPLIQATGASVFQWNMGGKCCGASQMNTKSGIAQNYVADILRAAKGADAIVTVCPMCQINLEAYQKKISSTTGEDLSISIIYLPQLIGIALGISEKELGLNFNLAITNDFKKKIKSLD